MRMPPRVLEWGFCGPSADLSVATRSHPQRPIRFTAVAASLTTRQAGLPVMHPGTPGSIAANSRDEFEDA